MSKNHHVPTGLNVSHDHLSINMVLLRSFDFMFRATPVNLAKLKRREKSSQSSKA